MAINYKNIVGTGFPDYIKEQLKARQKLISESPRNSTALQFLTNRNSFVRLSSGVLVKEGPNDYTNTLAKNNVLQGGTIVINNNITTFKDTFNQRYTIGATDNLGFKPNPGITNLNIGTGGRWQTLLQADVEFICYDLDQLDIMSKLYMSLGCHVFLEWGHIPYIDNSGALQKNITPLDFFNGKFKLNKDLLPEINRLRKNSKGNYDALLGRVYNFDFNANPDGTYNCKIQVMGPGQMIESIKINTYSNKDNDEEETNEAVKYSSVLENSLIAIQKFLEKSEIAKVNVSGTSSSGGIGGASSTITKKYNLGKIGKDNFFTPLVDTIPGIKQSYANLLNNIYRGCSYRGPDFNNGGVNYINNLASFGNAHQIISNLEENTGDDGLKPITDLDFYAGYASLLNTNDSSEKQYSTYITLGHLFTLVQHVGIFTESPTISNDGDSDISPVIYLDYHPDNTIINRGPLEASIDPGTCLVPLAMNPLGQFKSPSASYGRYMQPLNTLLETLEDKKINNASKNLFAFNNSEKNKINKGIGKESFEGKIFNVLVNLDFAINTLRGLYSNRKNTDVDLQQYLNAILDGINLSLGQVNNLRLFFDDNSYCLRVIDEIVTEKINQENLLQIPNYGIESTAYDYSFQSKIGPNLAAQIVISTQAENSGGLQEFPEDILTYKKLNGDIKDKFAAKLTTGVTDTTNTQEPEYIKPLQSLFDHIYNCYSELSEELINPSTINSFLNVYKDLQNKRRKLMETSFGNVLIPLEYSITIDGISGILPYNAFIVPENRLPKKYRGTNGKPKISFAVFSINHNFENNQWTTTLRGQTLLLDKAFITETNTSN